MPTSRPPGPSLHLLYKPGGSDTQRKHEKNLCIRVHTISRWLTVSHCSATSEAETWQQTRELVGIQSWLGEPPHPLRFCPSGVVAHSGILTEKFPLTLVHPSNGLSVAWPKPHEEAEWWNQELVFTTSSRIMELSACIRNIGQIEEYFGAACKRTSKLRNTVADRNWTVVRLLSVKLRMA